MNKFDVINKVLTSDLGAEDKCLLIELVMRSDDEWTSWPSVKTLCKARGMRNTKHFKGVDHYLPGLFTIKKKGRKNFYTLNTPAVEGLSEAQVNVKETPTTYNPAVEGSNSPAVADNSPAVPGANSTKNNTRDSSTLVPDGPVDMDTSLKDKVKETFEEIVSSLNFKEGTFPSLLNLEGATVLNFTKGESHNETLEVPEQKDEEMGFTNLQVADMRNAVSKSARLSGADATWQAEVMAIATDPNFKPEITNPTVRAGHAASELAKSAAAGGDW